MRVGLTQTLGLTGEIQMTETTARPVVVFGKLAGVGLLFLGLAALVAAIGFFITVANSAHESQVSFTSAIKDVPERDFQLVQLGNFRRDQFLVDKSSGRVWQSVCSGPANGPDCNGMLIWDEMYVGGVTPSDSGAALAYFQHAGRKP